MYSIGKSFSIDFLLAKDCFELVPERLGLVAELSCVGHTLDRVGPADCFPDPFKIEPGAVETARDFLIHGNWESRTLVWRSRHLISALMRLASFFSLLLSERSFSWRTRTRCARNSRCASGNWVYSLCS